MNRDFFFIENTECASFTSIIMSVKEIETCYVHFESFKCFRPPGKYGRDTLEALENIVTEGRLPPSFLS